MHGGEMIAVGPCDLNRLGERPARVRSLTVPVKRQAEDRAPYGPPRRCRSAALELERLVSGSGVAVPRRRAAVKLWDERRRRARELVAQQLCEQVVVAIPLPPGVERHDERVLALEATQERCRGWIASHRRA